MGIRAQISRLWHMPQSLAGSLSAKVQEEHTAAQRKEPESNSQSSESGLRFTTKEMKSARNCVLFSAIGRRWQYSLGRERDGQIRLRNARFSQHTETIKWTQLCRTHLLAHCHTTLYILAAFQWGWSTSHHTLVPGKHGRLTQMSLAVKTANL